MILAAAMPEFGGYVKKKDILLGAFLLLVAYGSGIVREESLQYAGQEVLQANNEGAQVSMLPEYVTRYPELYATGGGPDTERETTEPGETICEKIAYLSFDDGPSEITPEILDILKEYDAKATFFLIGAEITPEREEIVKRIVAEGHSIGLHSYSHDYKVLYSSVDAFLKDYEKACVRVYELTGTKPWLYRFPGGSRNSYAGGLCEDIASEMERRGFCYYDWNVSAEDSVGKPTAYSIRSNVFKDVYRYDDPVLLMHDSLANELTVKVLPEILRALSESGYSFDTLENRERCQFSW